MENYIPTEEDFNWATNITRYIREGGMLAYPATRLIYCVYNRHKELILINPDELQDKYSKQVHERTIVVFSKIGYTVKEKDMINGKRDPTKG